MQTHNYTWFLPLILSVSNEGACQKERDHVFCSQQPTVLPFLCYFWSLQGYLAVALITITLWKMNFIFFFFQLSLSLAAINASAHSFCETKLLVLFPSSSSRVGLFVLYCQTFAFLSLYVFIHKWSVSQNTVSDLTAFIKWPSIPSNAKISVAYWK